jgi:hypothetical protein
MTFIAPNPERAAMRADAIAAVKNDTAFKELAPTVADVAKFLPADFYNDMNAAEQAMELAEALAPPEATTMAPQPAKPTGPYSAEAQNQAAEQHRQCVNDVSMARQRLRAAEDTRRIARGTLAESVMLFQTGGVKRTREQLVREEIANCQALKMAIANGTAPARQRRGSIGPSYIDRQAAPYAGAGAFARKTMRRGYRKNGLPSNYRGGWLNSETGRIQNTKPKLPSDW